jgi:hypothetical protein
MAKDSGTTILLLGGLGVAVYGYFQGWFASFGLAPAAAAAPVTTTPTVVAPTPTMPATAPTTSTPAPVATAPAATTTTAPASSSGQSLASMLAALQTAIAQNASDPAFNGTGASSNPTATCDVFNYYLTLAAVGVPNGMLDCSPIRNNGPLTLTAYWAWAAPLLQAQFPGLSGLGYVYAGLNALAKRRGW